VKANLPARTLATRLLSAHKQFLSAEMCGCISGCRCQHFTNEQRRLAVEMLTTHIEASRRLGTPGDLKAAATDTIFIASLNETAYEPIPVRGPMMSSSLGASHHGAWAEEL